MMVMMKARITPVYRWTTRLEWSSGGDETPWEGRFGAVSGRRQSQPVGIAAIVPGTARAASIIRGLGGARDAAGPCAVSRDIEMWSRTSNDMMGTGRTTARTSGTGRWRRRNRTRRVSGISRERRFSRRPARSTASPANDAARSRGLGSARLNACSNPHVMRTEPSARLEPHHCRLHDPRRPPRVFRWNRQAPLRRRVYATIPDSFMALSDILC